MFSKTNLAVLTLCLTVVVRAVKVTTSKVQTISINHPTSGAHLNPIGAAVNTKIQTQAIGFPYGSPYGLPFGSPFGAGIAPGIGFGANLGGFGGAYGGVINPLAAGGFGAQFGGYGSKYGVGYPGIPGSYTVQQIGYPALSKAGQYYPTTHGFAGYNSVGGYNQFNQPYGFSQISYNQGYQYGGVNKLAGYGK